MKSRRTRCQNNDLFEFLEIYAIMILTVKSAAGLLDSKLLLTIISKHINKKYLAKSYTFSLNQIAELYWVYGVLEIFEDGECKELVKPLESILNDILAEYIAKHKPLTDAEIYDGLKQELEFDEKDIDVIRFYYDKNKDNGWLTNSAKTIKLIDSIKKKYDDRPEGERKWFVI